MKKIGFLLLLAAALLACSRAGNSRAITSDDLQGCYELDFTSLLGKAQTEADALTAAFISMCMNATALTLRFEEKTMLVDSENTFVRTFISSLDPSISLPLARDYKIERDSCLYLYEDGAYQDAGVLRRIGETCDYLQWVIISDGDTIALNLRKLY